MKFEGVQEFETRYTLDKKGTVTTEAVATTLNEMRHLFSLEEINFILQLHWVLDEKSQQHTGGEWAIAINGISRTDKNFFHHTNFGSFLL